jgi:hypothetical protein
MNDEQTLGATTVRIGLLSPPTTSRRVELADLVHIKLSLAMMRTFARTKEVHNDYPK